MTTAPVPDQSAVQTALRAFLLAVLPAGVEAIEGQDNRVPEPVGADFVVMTAIRRDRLATNFDDYIDCAFVASIATTVMTVTELLLGAIGVGNAVFGTGVAAGTVVSAEGTGSGGVGTYTISPSQTVASETMAAGIGSITQSTKVTYQLDFHSADVGDAADMAQTVSTLFRDEFATRFFRIANPAVSPLYADDPRQMPFLNDQQQYETRWIVEAVLQVDQTVTVPQQFADEVTVDLVNVEAAYPA